jgi:hypothetical protein
MVAQGDAAKSDLRPTCLAAPRRHNPAMSTTVRVVHPNDFLRARADGHVDLEAGKALLSQLATASHDLQRFEMLIDLRDATGHLTAEDLYALADSLAEFKSTFSHRTAVLCPRERFDNVRFFSLLASSRGYPHIHAFLAFEDAMDWLMRAESA